MTHEQLQQIRAIVYDAYCEGDTEAWAMLVVIDATRAAPEQDPVAWQERQIIGKRDGVYKWSHWYSCGYRTDEVAKARTYSTQYEWRPLYTHPMPEPVAPEPVAIGEINEAWKVFRVWFGNTDWTVADAANYRIIFGHGYNFGAARNAAPQDQDAKDAADIFWDYEDGEYCVRSIQEICENACDRGAENGAVLRVNQAKSLPHIFLRLIVPENPDDSVDYITISESEAIATMQQEQLPGVCQMQASLDDKRDAERWRFLTQQMDESEVDYLCCFDTSDWAGRVDAAMQQEQKT